MELSREPRNSHTNIMNRSLTKEQKQFNGERIIFIIYSVGTTDAYRQKGRKGREGKKKNLDIVLTPFMKNSLWVIGFNVKHKIYKTYRK